MENISLPTRAINKDNRKLTKQENKKNYYGRARESSGGLQKL